MKLVCLKQRLNEWMRQQSIFQVLAATGSKKEHSEIPKHLHATGC